MEFKFDASKSKKNLDKHGIDFVEAQSLWEDEDRLEIPARTEDEPRFVLIAMLGQKLWSAFFTSRSGRIRLIPVRRARQEERMLYTMKAKNLEKMFDDGKDVTPYLAISKARRPGHEQKRVDVDFPSWIIESLDAQASRLGVTRQSVIKLWIAERLKEETKKAS